MSTAREEALLALAAKDEAERNLARISVCPPSRHAAFATIVATLVGTPALPRPLQPVAFILVLVAVYYIVQWDKRRLGVFISGYRRGKTWKVTFPMLALISGLELGSYFCSFAHRGPGISLALAALAFIVAYLGSTLWQHIFVRELSA